MFSLSFWQLAYECLLLLFMFLHELRILNSLGIEKKLFLRPLNKTVITH